MGCTWISVVSLIVLIFASFVANMKATTQTSSAVTKRDEITSDSTPIRSESQTDQMPTNTTVISTSPVTKCQMNIRFQRQSIGNGSNNLSEKPNCTHFEQETTQVTFPTGTITVGSTEDENYTVTYRDFPEYIHYKTLGSVSPYVSNIPGFFTNSFTILVATRMKPFHTSKIYMIVLGCADLVTVTVRFTMRIFEIYVNTRSSADCKILFYMTCVAQAYSNLILVSWTVERCIAVLFPIKLASWCSVRNTKITAALLLLFISAINVPYITGSDIVTVWNGREIMSVCNFSPFIFTTWFHIESVYYIYLPMLLVCICNLTILYRLRSMTKARVSMACNQEIIDKKSKENKKMTILLLTISGTFLALHIPYAIVMVVEYMHPDVIVILLEDPHAFAKYLLYTSIGYYVTEFQNSINFFLYCISGNKFRSTFRKLFCRYTLQLNNRRQQNKSVSAII